MCMVMIARTSGAFVDVEMKQKQEVDKLNEGDVFVGVCV